MLTILTSYVLEGLSQPLYSHYMNPVSYDFTNNSLKNTIIVTDTCNAFTKNRGDIQTCGTWFCWLLSNQCCQGTRKMET